MRGRASPPHPRIYRVHPPGAGTAIRYGENIALIGHFRVPKTLTFKMRLGAQPFL